MDSAAAFAIEFLPFPEPAVGPFPDTVKMTLESQLLPAEIGAVTLRSGVLLNGLDLPKRRGVRAGRNRRRHIVVRVTDPANLVHLGIMPTTEPASISNLWGDVAVYDTVSGSYAYYTTEADGVGINVLDLTQLDVLGTRAESEL